MSKIIDLKVVSVVLGFAMIFALALPTTAGAATIEELMDQIAALQAELNSLQGSSAGSCGFTRSLTIGSSGADVTCLQNYLTGTGHFNFSGGSTGYFGPITQSAVAAWQASHGVAPAVGYFGPISTAKYNMLMAGSGSGSTGSGSGSTGSGSGSTGLSGGAGSIDDADFVSSLSNEEVGEDQDDVEVAGIDIEADGSDIEITAVTLDFSKGTGANSGDDLDDYARDVSIWLDGEMFAQLDADEFEDDDDYSDTVSLDRGAIIREGDEGRLVVAISGATNLDSDQTGDEWNVEFETVRYRDGQGSVISDSTTGDINGVTRTFSFESFASAADVNLVFTLSDDSPEAMVVNVDDSDNTDNVELLRFEIEAEGDSDLRLRDLPITLTATGATNIDALVNTLRVTIDGDEYSESLGASLGSSATTTLDDFDYTIDAGDTVEVIVEVDLNDSSTSGFDEGDTIKAEFTASNRNMLDVDDEAGETLTSTDRTGTALGEAMALYDVAPNITLVDVDQWSDPIDGADNDTGTFEIVYDVTAVDGDIYVGITARATTATTPTAATSPVEGVYYLVDKSGTATEADLNSAVSFVEDGNRVTDVGVTNGVKISEGSTGSFTATLTRTNSGDSADNGLYRGRITAITWATTDTATQNNYTFNLDEYKTTYVSLD